MTSTLNIYNSAKSITKIFTGKYMKEAIIYREDPDQPATHQHMVQGCRRKHSPHHAPRRRLGYDIIYIDNEEKRQPAEMQNQNGPTSCPHFVMLNTATIYCRNKGAQTRLRNCAGLSLSGY